MMDESPSFLRFRTIAFSCANFLSFVWVILYSVVAFLQWDLMDSSERALLAVMLIANVITVMTLLVLLLLEFRVWLDVARICSLLVAQIGTAGAFVYWRPQFRCEEKLGDQQGVCDMISFYILISSWIVPILLLSYLGGLAFRSHRRRSVQCTPTSDTEKAYPILKDDLNLPNSSRPSLLPIMTHLTTPISLASPSEAYSKARQSVNTRRSAGSAPSRHSLPLGTPTSAARLSKRSPLLDYA
ncbi:hypothetical protein P691DRAFT_775467 [Macrolepiota fuliginosa MF-IS2]|uniref:Transmembrane protein n=1 Tax=Macrolepiota fuliginosa MF-IS2 TaxID=1400762 RepID=A0A9P6C4K6_9AGAR|nr:hypothetical protein P691DRAFT_775467 [Macrolepiota fuliginosa MF-IS2]